jgi:hypothetical protein
VTDELVPVRRCPDCGEEFQPHVVNCSECGTLLEDAIEGESPAGSAAPEEDAAKYATLASDLDVDSTRAASEHLAEAGLRFRIVTTRARRGWLDLQVHEEDGVAASALLQREGILPPRDDSPPVGADGGPCPACQTHVEPGTLECPECGLVLGGEIG